MLGRVKGKFFLPLFLCIASCQVPTRISMDGVGGRTAYNVAIQMTSNQQMLLNLVRLRYIDTPMFLEVSGVTTQYTYKSRISPTIPIPGFNEENPFILGGELSWQDQPTISYAPLEGKSFTERLLRPIPLPILQQLIYSGWEIERIFILLLQNFEDLYRAEEMSSPAPTWMPRFQNYSEVVAILQYFQVRGELQLGVRMGTKKDDDFEMPDQALQIAVPDGSARAERLRELLPTARRHNGKLWIHLELGFNEHGRLGIMPRTILSTMYYLSQGILIPEHHVSCGNASEASCEEMNEVLKEFFQVQMSDTYPSDAFIAVQYKKHWYYIADSDLSTKKTFSLLMQLYNLNAQEPRNTGPILTLPLR